MRIIFKFTSLTFMYTILITNLIVSKRSGTEVVVEQLADGLRQKGHKPIIYAPVLGEQARAMRRRGHIMVDRIANVPSTPDIIHGHHNGPTMAALAAFPDVPAIFVCHSIVSHFDTPPMHPRIHRYLAVSDLIRERCVGDGLEIESVKLLQQAVDAKRFQRRSPLPDLPNRVLVLTKNNGHLNDAQEACRQLRVECDIYGPNTGRFSDTLQNVLPNYDLVIATGRSALEAAFTGCAVIVCDTNGFAGNLTSENVSEWCRLNLAVGLQIHPTTKENILSAIKAYRAEDAAKVTSYVREIASLEKQIVFLENIYSEVFAMESPDSNQDALAIAAFIENYVPNLAQDRPWKRLVSDMNYNSLQQEMSHAMEKAISPLLKNLESKITTKRIRKSHFSLHYNSIVLKIRNNLKKLVPF